MAFSSPQTVVYDGETTAKDYIAGENLSAGSLVYLSDDFTVKATNTSQVFPIGVALDNASSGKKVAVLGAGSRVYVCTREPVAAGDLLIPATSGRVQKASLNTTATHYVVGVALEDQNTSDGHVRVLISPQVIIKG